MHPDFDLRILACNILQVVRTADVIFHPQWNGNLFYGFDLALLRLEKPVMDVAVPLLAHPDVRIPPGSQMRTLVWGGEYQYNGSQVETKLLHLQIANAVVFHNRDCPGHLKDHMVCCYTEDLHPCKGEIP